MGQIERAQRKLDLVTSMPPQEVIAAAKSAVEAIGSVGTTRLKVLDESPTGFTVALKPTIVAGAHGSGKMSVAVGSLSAGKTSVRTTFAPAAVIQSKFLYLIPTGPKQVLGLKAYERAIDAIGAVVQADPPKQS